MVIGALQTFTGSYDFIIRVNGVGMSNQGPHEFDLENIHALEKNNVFSRINSMMFFVGGR